MEITKTVEVTKNGMSCRVVVQADGQTHLRARSTGLELEITASDLDLAFASAKTLMDVLRSHIDDHWQPIKEAIE
jgi:hypothetical protein